MGMVTHSSASSTQSSGDAGALVAEQNDRRSPCGFEPGQWCGVIGELDRDDAPSLGAHRVEPGVLVWPSPVDVRSAPHAERVAMVEGLPVVLGRWHGDTGADRVAGPQERAEVGFERDPQRRGDKSLPASVLPRTAILP